MISAMFRGTPEAMMQCTCSCSPRTFHRHPGQAEQRALLAFERVGGLDPAPDTRGSCAGRLFQKGDVMAFGAIHKRARGVGTISAIGGIGVSACPQCMARMLIASAATQWV